jgi:hypothetical protein
VADFTVVEITDALLVAKIGKIEKKTLRENIEGILRAEAALDEDGERNRSREELSKDVGAVVP